MRKNTQSKCRACGKLIEFKRTPNDRWMPIDPTPYYFALKEDGSKTLVTEQGRIVRCELVSPSGYYDPALVGFRPHWDSCTESATFRGSKASVKREQEDAARKAEAEKQKEELAAKKAEEQEEAEAKKRQLTFFGT